MHQPPPGRRPVHHRVQGSLFGLRRRLAAAGSGIVDTFLRDNKVIPLVLALLALFVLAWMVAGRRRPVAEFRRR